MRASMIAALPVVVFTLACALPGTRYGGDDRGETGWTDTEWWPSMSDTEGDSGGSGSEPLVYDVNDPRCADDVWDHEIEVEGVPDSAELWVRDTIADPSQGERHTLVEVELTTNGVTYQLALQPVDEGESWSDGQSALGCAREDMLTWFYVLRGSDDQVLDCAVTGAEPEFTGAVDEGDTEAVPEGCFTFD